MRKEIYFAMKVMKKKEILNRNQKLHTQAERKILENMDSNFIIRLHYAFQTTKKLFLVMDFMQGGLWFSIFWNNLHLSGELFYLLRKASKFNEDFTRFYAAEIILAVEYLHKRGIIYRDLKPENILLNADGHIKMCDFGLSKEGIKSEFIIYIKYMGFLRWRLNP